MNKINISLPALRFKEFDDEWLSVKVSDILQYEQPTKYIVDSSDYDNLFKIPVLTANKGFILGYTNEINNIYNKGPSIIFDDFTTDFKYVDFPYKIKSSAIKILTSKNDYYLYFIFNLWQKNKFIPIGHNRHYISIIQEIFFYIPPIEEQTKIANFFTLLDKQIQLIERKLELYELRKKYYLNNMFCDKDKIVPKLRFNKFCHEWAKKQQKCFISENNNIAKDDINKRITIKLNLNGVYKRETRAIEKESSGTVYLRNEGDFIYGKQNFHKGCFGIIPKELDGFVSSSDLPSFKLDATKINSKFFISFWKNTRLYSSMETHMTGTGSKRLNQKVFLDYCINIPNIEEQTKIGNLFSSLDESIQNVKKQKDQLTKRKTYYLNNMFV